MAWVFKMQKSVRAGMTSYGEVMVWVGPRRKPKSKAKKKAAGKRKQQPAEPMKQAA